MKLELKHILPYSDHGLKFFPGAGRKRKHTLKKIYFEFKEHIYLNGYFAPYAKLILKPLEDLTKPENAIELYNFLVDNRIHIPKYALNETVLEARIVQKPFGKIYKLSHAGDWVCVISLEDTARLKHKIFDFLCSKHYDMFNLIKNDLAVNANDF